MAGFSGGSFSGGSFSVDSVAPLVIQGGVPFYAYYRARRLHELSEEEARATEKAVLEAAEAEAAIAAAIDKDRDIAAAIEARRLAEEAYLAAHQAALMEQYLETAILQRFREEVAYRRLEIKRRAALLLLLS
jgi:hypothetical protein